MASTVQLVIVILVWTTSVMGEPQACTYTNATKSYECNAHNWALPLELWQFNNTPQVISLIQVNGELPASAPSGPTFSGFESIDTSSFDNDITPGLHIRCASSGQIILTSGSLTNMSYIKELRFFDCAVLNLPDEVFLVLVDLNYLSFHGGSISNIGFDAFSGLDLYPMNVSNPRGTLAIRNCQITSSGLPNGALFNLPNITQLIIENAALRVLQPDMFKKNTKLTYISLSRNPFIKISDGLFADLDALTEVDMHGIDWDCTCPQLWFQSFFTTNNITLNGDIVCATPTDYTDTRAKKYYSEICDHTDACGDLPGIATGSYCITYWDITAYSLHPIVVAMAAVALGLTIYTRRQLDFVKEDRQGTRPIFGARKLSGSNWNKVVDEKPKGSKQNAVASNDISGNVNKTEAVKKDKDSKGNDDKCTDDDVEIRHDTNTE